MTTKHAMNKENNNRHTKVNGRKPTRPQPQAVNYRQIGNTESGKYPGKNQSKNTPIIYAIPNGQS